MVGNGLAWIALSDRVSREFAQMPDVHGATPIERLNMFGLQSEFLIPGSICWLGVPGVRFCGIALFSPDFPVRRNCLAFVVSSRRNHGAQETFFAQEGLRQEGWQEEVGQAVGQAQREEGRQEAQFPQAQVQEGWRRCLRTWCAKSLRGVVRSTEGVFTVVVWNSKPFAAVAKVEVQCCARRAVFCCVCDCHRLALLSPPLCCEDR